MIKQKGRGLFLSLCVFPATLMYIIFMVIPTFQVFYLSLFKTSKYKLDQKKFVGLDNFESLFSNSRFIASFQNTILLIVVITIVTLAFALIYAGILSREKIKGQNFFRIVFYIPNILSIVVIANIFAMAYRKSSSGHGLINSILSALGANLFDFMEDKTVIYSIAVALIWQAIGYYMVMYMSSMAAIPESIYESAALEGASRIRVFFDITLPLIWTNIRTTLTFFVISTINLSFLFVRAFIGNGANESSNVLLYYMTKDAGGYGAQMAAGVVVFIFSFAMSGIINAITKREVLEF